jgi:hypothetical protein
MAHTEEIKIQNHLNTDALIQTTRTGFAGIREHRSCTVTHTLADSLIADFAMFSLKDPHYWPLMNEDSEAPRTL